MVREGVRICPDCLNPRGIWGHRTDGSDEVKAWRVSNELKRERELAVSGHRNCFSYAGDIADVMV